MNPEGTSGADRPGIPTDEQAAPDNVALQGGPGVIPSRLRQMGRGGAAHVLVAASARMFSLLAAAIFVRTLSPAEFGVYSLALLNEQVVFILLGFALANAMGKFYSDTRRGLRDEATVVGTAVTTMVLVALGGGLLWQVVAEPLARLTLGEGRDAVAASRLIGLSTASTMILNVVLAIWLLNVQLRPYAIATVGQYALTALIGGGLVAGFDTGPAGAVAGWALGSAVTAAGSLVWVYRRYRPTIDRTTLREMFRYGVPLIPGALTMLVLQVNDRYVVRGYEGLAEVGVYSAALTIATGLYAVIVTAFKRIWTALMWDMRAKAGEEEFHRRVLTYYVAVQGFVLILVVAYADVGLALLSGNQSRYTSEAGIVGVVYAGFVIFGMWDVLSAGYFFAGKTIHYSVSVAAATVAGIAFNLLAVPRWGIWAAAASYPLTYGVLTLVSAIAARRYFPVAHDWTRILRLAVSAGACTLLAVLARRSGGPIGEAGTGLAVLAYPFLAALGAGLDGDERRLLSRTLGRFTGRPKAPASGEG